MQATDKALFTFVCQVAETVVSLSLIRVLTVNALDAAPEEDRATFFNFSPKGPFKVWVDACVEGPTVHIIVVEYGSAAKPAHGAAYCLPLFTPRVLNPPTPQPSLPHQPRPALQPRHTYIELQLSNCKPAAIRNIVSK